MIGRDRHVGYRVVYASANIILWFIEERSLSRLRLLFREAVAWDEIARPHRWRGMRSLAVFCCCVFETHCISCASPRGLRIKEFKCLSVNGGLTKPVTLRESHSTNLLFGAQVVHLTLYCFVVLYLTHMGNPHRDYDFISRDSLSFIP